MKTCKYSPRIIEYLLTKYSDNVQQHNNIRNKRGCYDVHIHWLNKRMCKDTS